MAKIINLPGLAKPTTEEEHARADTERNQRLFDWALGVLKAVGVYRAVNAARSIEELHRVTFDADSVEFCSPSVMRSTRPMGVVRSGFKVSMMAASSKSEKQI